MKTRVQGYTQDCIAFMMEMSQGEQKKDKMDIWNEAQPLEGNSLALSFGNF